MVVEKSTRSASVFGMSLKHITLIALTIQNAVSILVMHYSRTMPLVNGHRYIPSTAVFLNELIKLPICLSMALYEIASSPKTPDTSSADALFGELARAVFTGDSWKLAIPAMLYTLQTSLQYVAIGNLDTATFQVTNQLKILSTALFSVVLLGRVLNSRAWSSLVLLMFGAAMVHVPTGAGSAVLSIRDLRRDVGFQEAQQNWDLKAMGNIAVGLLSKRSATYQGIDEDYAEMYPEQDASLGFTTLAMACILSGLANVYFEKVLKHPKTEYGSSVWIRNVQLSFYSLWPALFIGVMFKDGEHITKTGFFTGYNWVVWTAILLQVTGGLLVAFVVKFANNITKNFATSVSILLSCLASVILFDFQISSFYVMGTAMVISATYLYNTPPPDTNKTSPPRVKISESEQPKTDASYFDVEYVTTPSKSPLRGEGRSSSRPSTPTVERVPHRIKSSDLRMYKREQ